MKVIKENADNYHAGKRTFFPIPRCKRNDNQQIETIWIKKLNFGQSETSTNAYEQFWNNLFNLDKPSSELI